MRRAWFLLLACCAAALPAQQVALAPDSLTLAVGDTSRVVATLTGASGLRLSYRGTNAQAFTVHLDGRVTARAPGCGYVRVGVVDSVWSRAQVRVCVVARDTVVPPVPSGHANEPAGFTPFLDTDYTTLPASTGMRLGAGSTLARPASNISVASDGLRYHHLAGTRAGYTPPDYAQFNLWARANELSNDEYRAVYLRHEVTLRGDGTSYETPAGPGFKALGYIGVANNNQSPVTGAGPVQLYTIASPVDAVRPSITSPLQATRFRLDMYTQNGVARALPQNRNLGTHLKVGTRHVVEMVLRLNDVGQANGIWQWWIDGALVGDYRDVEFIAPRFAQYGSTGLSGFFGLKVDAVWGGSGGPDKTRTDVTVWHRTYASGEFLRAAARGR